MTRVMLMTGQPILTRGLATILGSLAEFELCGICYEAGQLLDAAAAAKPDILIMDLECDISLELVEALRRRVPESKVVLWVSNFAGEPGFQFMRLGIRGIVRKAAEPADVVRSLRNVAAGQYCLDDRIARDLSCSGPPLSRRERQLMSLLAEGMKNKEIAAALSIAEGTVKVYLSRLFRKVGVRDRYELALHGLKSLIAEEARAAGGTDSG